MPDKNLGGRPRKEINLEQVKAMCRIQCTQEEVCAILEVDDKTLSARLREAGYSGFSEFHKKYNHEGKASLRRAQWKAATQDNNPTMLVWLGKNMLGQTDKQDVRMSGEMAHKIQVQFIDDDDDEEEDD